MERKSAAVMDASDSVRDVPCSESVTTDPTVPAARVLSVCPLAAAVQADSLQEPLLSPPALPNSQPGSRVRSRSSSIHEAPSATCISSADLPSNSELCTSTAQPAEGAANSDSTHEADRFEAAFANLKLWSGGATAFSYFVFPHFSATAQMSINLCLLVLGISGYFMARSIARRSGIPGVTARRRERMLAKQLQQVDA